MNNNDKNQQVGENISAREASWSFGGSVPEQFSAHIRRSVPFYDVGHELVCKMSDFFIKDDSRCYELGVSTGTLLNRLAQRHAHRPDTRWIGIDREPAMIDQAKKEVTPRPNLELVVDDISTHAYRSSDLVVSYYTMQFVPPRLRQGVFRKIFGCLNQGGAFILFEKVRASDARFQDMLQQLYTDYKLEQNYTPEEIVAKAKSLKGVLEPLTSRENLDLFAEAGFRNVVPVFKYICFEGVLAIK